MLKHTFAIVLLLYSAIVCGNNVVEQPQTTVLRYGNDPAGAWIPFSRTDSPDRPGIFAEILPMLMSNAGLRTESFSVPTKRGLKKLYSGELDFDFVNPDWMSEQDKREFVYSIPLFEVTEYFISLQTNPTSFEYPENAYDQLVGTVSGYYYFDDDKFTRADFRSESEVILGLSKQRFNVAIMEKAAANYWSEQHSVGLKFGAIHTQGNIVLRLRAELAYILPRINQAAQLLKEQGDIKRILEKYVGKD